MNRALPDLKPALKKRKKATKPTHRIRITEDADKTTALK